MENNIGKNIRRFRVAKGMTQQQLADKLYVTRSALSSYENGGRTPSLAMAILIADFFQVTLDELVGRNEKI